MPVNQNAIVTGQPTTITPTNSSSVDGADQPIPGSQVKFTRRLGALTRMQTIIILLRKKNWRN